MTLIELMIVVVIIGILAAVAFPSFMEQIRKGRRSDAIQALTAVQQAQERWRSTRSTYTSDLTTAQPNGLGMAATSGGGYYTLAIDAADGTGYTLTATAVSGKSQASDTDCVRMRVRATGGTVVTGSAAAAGAFAEGNASKCWSQ